MSENERRQLTIDLLVVIAGCVLIFILGVVLEIRKSNLEDNYSNRKKNIILLCEQRYLDNYAQIKDCIDFELNYKH